MECMFRTQHFNPLASEQQEQKQLLELFAWATAEATASEQHQQELNALLFAWAMSIPDRLLNKGAYAGKSEARGAGEQTSAYTWAWGTADVGRPADRPCCGGWRTSLLWGRRMGGQGQGRRGLAQAMATWRRRGGRTEWADRDWDGAAWGRRGGYTGVADWTDWAEFLIGLAAGPNFTGGQLKCPKRGV
jgi:hypothetical protein